MFGFTKLSVVSGGTMGMKLEMTVVAIQMALKKVRAHRSYRVAMWRQSSIFIILTVLSAGFVTAHGQAFWLPPYEIYVRNNSCKDIQLVIHYLDYNDDVWETRTYSFYPGEGAYLASGGDRLQTEEAIYYRAEYEDGSGRLYGGRNRNGRWVYVRDERVWMDGFWDFYGYDIDLWLGAEFSNGLCHDNAASIREGELKKQAEAKQEKRRCENECDRALGLCRLEFPVRTDKNCAAPYRKCMNECGSR